MPRESARKLMGSIINRLNKIPLGVGEFMPVGDGTDPPHEFPYLVVREISSAGMEGPPNDTDADATSRIQITAVGNTRNQADFGRDKARELMTKTLLNQQFVADSLPRSVMSISLELGRMDRWDRGTATPVFAAVDQYLVHTTPRVIQELSP